MLSNAQVRYATPPKPYRSSAPSTSPAPAATGDWNGISVSTGGTAVLSNAQVRYAYDDLSGDSSSSINVTDSTLSDASYSLDSAGAVNVRHTQLLGANVAVSAQNPQSLVSNWWGSATGPSPNGSGSRLTGNGSFSPWCVVADCSRNSSYPVFSLGTAVSVVEGQPVAVTVKRTGDTSTPTQVQLMVTSGTATVGQDLPDSSQLISFDAGQTTATVSLPTTDDTTAEPTETFRVALTVPTGTIASLTAPTALNENILDNDRRP